MKNVLGGLFLALTISTAVATPAHALEEASVTDAQRVRIELGAKAGYQYLLSHANRAAPYWGAVTYAYIELYQDQLFDHTPAGQASAEAAEQAAQNWETEGAGDQVEKGGVDRVAPFSQVKSDRSNESLADN